MHPAASDYRRLHSKDIEVKAVKNHDIFRDGASHFKLARSVLKIAPSEFAKLQYFKAHSRSTFINFKKMLG